MMVRVPEIAGFRHWVNLGNTFSEICILEVSLHFDCVCIYSPDQPPT